MINLTKIQSKCKPGNENCSMKPEQDFKNACQTCIDKYSKWVEVHNESLINKKCKRYHREMLIDKYGGKLSLQSKLLYIETGQTRRKLFT